VETIGANIPITTVHNGIDLERFNQATPIDRKTLGFKNDDFIVVYSGRLIKEKGIEELIDTFYQLKDYPQIKLLILGGSFYGLSDNTPFLYSLKKKVKNIKDSIVFTGFIPYEQLPRYLKVGDVAVVPSIWEEPFGLTCIEAIAAGLPLITTNSGGIPEICNNYAFIIGRFKIVNQLTKSLLHLYRNNEDRNRMQINSKKYSGSFKKELYSEQFYTEIAQIR
jgi:glycosyltransferase involved in cell wall biosynthesis